MDVHERIIVFTSTRDILSLASLLGSLLGLNNRDGFICRKHLLIIVWFE